MKKWILLVCSGICLLFSGCAGMDTFLQARMIEDSEITETESYKQYTEYQRVGNLTQEGYYQADPITEHTVYSETAAHITFADNSYLDEEYFLDENATVPLAIENCYLEPGTQIFARVSVNKKAGSSMYYFSGFRLYRYEDGEREAVAVFPVQENGLVMEITEEYKGAELSLEPIGDYETRTVFLKDYYLDENGDKQELSGTWLIDEKRLTGDRVEMSPALSYIISYEFDSKEYYFSSSVPNSYYYSNEDGIVIFNKREAADKTEDYSLELCRYEKVYLESDSKRKVVVNGETEQLLSKGEPLVISRLRYGDTILLETDVEWPELEKMKNPLLISQERLSEGYRYTILVQKGGDEFIFDPTEYVYEHGTIVFISFGEIITGVEKLPRGSRIYYEQGTAEPGFWLSEGENYIVVGENEETKEMLRSIHFVESPKVTVELPQPEYGGSIQYFADGIELKGTSFSTVAGTVIEVRIEPWEGWKTDLRNGQTYLVTAADRQTVSIGGQDVKKAFSEAEDHKPSFEVILKKGLSENWKFSFSIPELEEAGKEFSYQSAWYKNENTVIKDEKIGTHKGIDLVINGSAIQTKSAIRIVIEKTTNKGETTSETYLIDDLTEQRESFAIYKKEEIAVSEIWYTSIVITISMADVLYFEEPVVSSNATLTVTNLSTGKALQQGDIIEKEEKVSVTLRPKYGYFVAGKKVENEVYEDSMKFSEFYEGIKTILAEHPVTKYCVLSLPVSDEYGLCSYKLDKESVSGSVFAKEGQELTLEYEIQKDGYMIKDAKGLIFGIGKNDQKKKESLTVTREMDGKTIVKEDFGIEVVKKEAEDE